MSFPPGFEHPSTGSTLQDPVCQEGGGRRGLKWFSQWECSTVNMNFTGKIFIYWNVQTYLALTDFNLNHNELSNHHLWALFNPPIHMALDGKNLSDLHGIQANRDLEPAASVSKLISFYRSPGTGDLIISGSTPLNDITRVKMAKLERKLVN